MSLQLVESNYRELYGRLGESGLQAAHPNDFEYYLIGFELRQDSRLTDRFIFPILPENIEMPKRKATMVKETFGGVVTLTTSKFVPFNITMSGSFGRRFKLLLNFVKEKGSDSFTNKVREKFVNDFNSSAKTGYGLMKELERIFNKSVSLSADNRPYELIFYNLAFNEIYYVEFNEFTPQQNQTENRIWRYTVSLTATAPANEMHNRTQREDLLRTNIFEDNLNNLVQFGSDNILNTTQTILSRDI